MMVTDSASWWYNDLIVMNQFSVPLLYNSGENTAGSLGPRLSSSFSSLVVNEKLDESLGPRLHCR